MKSFRSTRGSIPASKVNRSWAAVFAFCFPLFAEANAQESVTPAGGDKPASEAKVSGNSGSELPPIVVKPPVQKQSKQPAKKKIATPPVQAVSAPASTDAPTGPGAAYGDPGPKVTPSQAVPSLGKTGTPLANLPGSVTVIPREILAEQGAVSLNDSVTNSSGVTVGGQDSKGYFDHYLIRGLNAQIYSDGFSEGDQLGGVSHYLNGVQRVEVLEGPGSALFGSGPPGGTINIVHYKPSSEFHWGDTTQISSLGGVSNSFYVTGPSTIDGLNYRVDGTFARADSFRDLNGQDYELRPSFAWFLGAHEVDFSVDIRHINQTPDSYGIIYYQGQPIKNVPIDAKYSSPFDFAHQDYVRPIISDKWVVSDFLTVNNRFSYLYRTLDVVTNGDSSGTKVSGGEVVNRQLRQQDDLDNTFDYQFEPIWKFATSGIQHTLLTGFEYVHQTMATSRETAVGPADGVGNIANAFAPVVPETSLSGITFECNQTHSCDRDHLTADYLSAYATDQMDVTDKLKIRVGIRKDWWDTSLTPQITVPGRFNSEGQLMVGGVQETRNDAPVSWNAGALYKLFPWASPYLGVSQSYLTNFNSENTQNGIGAPESALQYETGIKFSFFNDKLVLNTAAFTVSRNNVAALMADPVISGVEDVVFDSQKTDGIEASIVAQLTSQWNLIANFTSENTVVTKNPQGLSIIGRHPQGAPGAMANLWTTYKFSIYGVDGFQIGGGLNYRNGSYSDTTNVNSIPAFAIGNAMLGYEANTWGITLNVKNFTNERYYLAANVAGAFVGEPLSAIVNVHLKY